MLKIMRYWRVKQGEDSAEIKGREATVRESINLGGFCALI
jgi:hypothetical protein